MKRNCKTCTLNTTNDTVETCKRMCYLRYHNQRKGRICDLEKEISKLKQTLREIKEIAEKMKKMSEEDGGELTECFFIDKQCEKCSEDKCLPYWFGQILQKISECEGNDG